MKHKYEILFYVTHKEIIFWISKHTIFYYESGWSGIFLDQPNQIFIMLSNSAFKREKQSYRFQTTCMREFIVWTIQLNMSAKTVSPEDNGSFAYYCIIMEKLVYQTSFTVNVDSEILYWLLSYTAIFWLVKWTVKNNNK